MPMILSPAELIRLKQAYLLPCAFHFYRDAPHVVRGEGPYLFDSEDRRYLDFYSGVSVNALGHADPAVVQAVAAQMGTLAHTTTIYLTQPMLELAEELAAVAPGKLRRTFFQADGSGANETAVLLAQNFTGRRGIICLGNSLHGNTKLTMSLTGLSFWRTDAWPVEGVTFAPTPHCCRCPLGRSCETCGVACAGVLDEILRDMGDDLPAAVMLEVVQGNGGIVVPPAAYFERLRDIVARYGLLLIVDEVQTGFGRTGRMFACEHFGLEPDILTAGKALGGGLPIGAVMATDAVAQAFKGPRASTFGGNLVVMKAAQTVLAALRERHLIENAAVVGAHFKQGLLALAERHALIGDVRGLGLMLGVELASADGSPATEATDTVLEEMKNRGVFVGKTGAGRNVLTFMPPLIIANEHVDEVLAALDDSLMETSRKGF